VIGISATVAVGTSVVSATLDEIVVLDCVVCVTRPFGVVLIRSIGGGVISPSSSGIGGQYVFSTCLSAGRRIGLDKKKSIPESRHSLTFDSSAY